MSSLFVRDEVESFLRSNAPSETIIPIDGDFDYINDLVIRYRLTPRSNWVGLQFIGAEEEPISLTANNSQGCYREIGVFYIHVVAPSTLGGARAILQRGEVIRDLIRGQRIADKILIERVAPVNLNAGATLTFQGGYSSGLIVVEYEYDKHL